MNGNNFRGQILAFEDATPRAHSSVLIADGARVIGDVTLAEGVSVWYNAVLRGDICGIRVGKFTNIQDLCLVHVDRDQPCTIGEYVVVGHSAILHACTVENSCLIGMGAKVLSGAIIGDGSIIAAGAVVLEETVIPPRSLAVGIPAKVLRNVTDEEVTDIKEWALRYNELASRHIRSVVPPK